MTGREVAEILQEALEDAGVPEIHRPRILMCFSLAWGKRLQREIDNAMFAEIKATLS